jgi:hypothetical protein
MKRIVEVQLPACSDCGLPLVVVPGWHVAGTNEPLWTCPNCNTFYED